MGWNHYDVSGSFNVSLNAKQAKLFQLAAARPANLRWNANGNSGIWDTGTSANWLNLSNSQQVVVQYRRPGVV